MNYENYPKTCKEAKATGSEYYFTGISCVNGHTEPRRTSGGSCPSCCRLRKERRAARMTEDEKAEEKRKEQERNAAWRKKNPDRVKEYRKEYRAENGDKLRQDMRSWVEANKEYKRHYDKKYYEDNKAKCIEVRRTWHARNRELANAKKRARRRSNVDLHKERNKIWRISNPIKIRALNAKRRAAKLKATPPWLTDDHWDSIGEFYEEAQRLSDETGEKHHVDHQIPLISDVVCGLHVPWNLCVIPALENLSKGNRLLKDAHTIH